MAVPTEGMGDTEPEKKVGVGTMVLWAVGVFLVAACGLGFLTNSDDGSSERDASADAACRHLANVAEDVADGVLTLPEIREKIQEVERSASASDDPVLAAAARATLAEITSGGDGSAMYDLIDACVART